MTSIIRIFFAQNNEIISFSLISTTVGAVSLNRTSEYRENFHFFMCRTDSICNFVGITFQFLWINPLKCSGYFVYHQV